MYAQVRILAKSLSIAIFLSNEFLQNVDGLNGFVHLGLLTLQILDGSSIKAKRPIRVQVSTNCGSLSIDFFAWINVSRNPVYKHPGIQVTRLLSSVPIRKNQVNYCWQRTVDIF